MSRRLSPYAVVALAADLPRFAVLVAERGDILGREWLAVGLVQTLVAAATAVLVYELACRVRKRRKAQA